MTSDRIEEIQKITAYPESRSVYQALWQVWNECEQEQNKKISEVVTRFSGDNLSKMQSQFVSLYGSDEVAQEKADSFAVGFGKACELICKELKNGF